MSDVSLTVGTAPVALVPPARWTRVLRQLSNIGWRSALVLALALWWELAPRLELTDPAFFPPLSEVLAAGWALALNGQLWQHTSASVARALGGFAIAVLYAVPLGLAIGWYRRLGHFLNPLIEVLRNTAPLALLPVFLLLLGIGEVSKVAMVVYACSWPLLLNTISAVKQVDPLLIKSARTMGASAQQLFLKVILPASVPTIFVGIRLASATAILVLVAAEMVGAKSGLGYLIIYAQYSFLIPDMYFGIIAITFIGVLFTLALEVVERRLTAWKPAPALA
ncbi:ABC transporter permease [Rhodoferax saidenbachensis]|uniref:NitT/TauT family transport system permease protein n=1 Tax=Rhodoferax saidenbachensis TaxID=1484693 RepID=A0ABU1ZNH4_9BURK|nr:ABC transporter permease [Rhodoferax saidenbachensis]MDR7307095.1 NitT/TauT family transport system permease protein [Rhodoferax saidenbachensis]